MLDVRSLIPSLLVFLIQCLPESRSIQQLALKLTPTQTGYAPDGKTIFYVSAGHSLYFLELGRNPGEPKDTWRTAEEGRTVRKPRLNLDTETHGANSGCSIVRSVQPCGRWDRGILPLRAYITRFRLPHSGDTGEPSCSCGRLHCDSSGSQGKIHRVRGARFHRESVRCDGMDMCKNYHLLRVSGLSL